MSSDKAQLPSLPVLAMWRVALMVLALLSAGGGTAKAGGADSGPKAIIAAQLRDQGYACDHPQSAVQDMNESKPGEAVWVVRCENAKYRVRLVPDMAAKVERID